jgi:hypothetical protein
MTINQLFFYRILKTEKIDDFHYPVTSKNSTIWQK